MTPPPPPRRGGTRMDPRGTVGTIHCYTQNMKALGLVVSEKKINLCFSHCKSMGANDPRVWAIFDPRGMIGMIGRIYKEDHYTLLHTKYESFRSCGFGEEDFFFM